MLKELNGRKYLYLKSLKNNINKHFQFKKYAYRRKLFHISKKYLFLKPIVAKFLSTANNNVSFKLKICFT